MSKDDEEQIDILMDGSKARPIVVEIDATHIAQLISDATQSPDRLCARAANKIVDYLATVHRNAQLMS